MSTFTIGETAERSGFSASALRYYEGIGLVEPSGRTDAGYRLYDGHALDRLAFIARAKQLGCSLDEITDLVGIWDGERCGPVQKRFHELVTTKLADAERQIAELTALTEQLRHAAGQLAGPPLDGSCSEGCACLALGTAPIRCTIGSDEIPARIELVERLRRTMDRLDRTEQGLLLHFPNRPDVDADVRRFAVDEKRCCQFWRFAVAVDGDDLTLRWDAPPVADDLVDRLLAYFEGDEPLTDLSGLL